MRVCFAINIIFWHCCGYHTFSVN